MNVRKHISNSTIVSTTITETIILRTSRCLQLNANLILPLLISSSPIPPSSSVTVILGADRVRDSLDTA